MKPSHRPAAHPAAGLRHSRRGATARRSPFRSVAALRRAALTALAALLVPLAAQAGRPLVTEDANVLDRGECELESFFAHARVRGAEATRTVSLQAGCGVGGATQLAVQGLRARGDGAADTLALVGKTALRAPTDDVAGITIAYALGADRPRDDPRWRRFRQESSTLLGVLTAPLGPATLHANLGWSRQRSTGTNATLWALALERGGAIDRLDLMTEVYGDDRDPAWLAAAARWHAVPGKLMLDASYAVQTAAGRPRLATVGLKLAF